MGSIYPIRRHVVVLLLVSAALVEAQMPRITRLPPPSVLRWYIHVVNGLSNGVLGVHCKSKDDDLGYQRLVYRGADFQWNFKVNFWGTTLFWCFLEKPGATVSFESFWPESKHLWLQHRCTNGTNQGTCIWTAKDDGIYLRNIPDNVDELIHEWLK